MVAKVKLKNGGEYWFSTIDKMTGAYGVFQIVGASMVFIGFDGRTMQYPLHEIESIQYVL